MFFLWLASIVTLCAGASITFGVLERAIDAQHNETARLADAALVDTRTVAARPALERQRLLVEARLRDLALDADKPTTVARFIRVAADAAAQGHVDLERIEERSSFAGSIAPADASTRAVSFEAVPLDVTLRGDYRSLLATIRALAVAPVTMEIGIASLDRDAPSAAAPQAAPGRLTARLHVALQRLTDVPLRAATAAPTIQDETQHARSL